MHAVRNIRLCTKDCLCLYVCPTGATDTENGQIDFSKCVRGCRACVDACPSGAISLVPETFPAQQPKTDGVKAGLQALAAAKVRQQTLAEGLAARADGPVQRQFAAALAQSNQLMAEDLLREAGYMLPQSGETRAFLEGLLAGPQPEGFPAEAARQLLALL